MAAHRGRRRSAGTKNTREGNLRPWLVRNAFMLRLFGMKEFGDLQRALSEIEEGTEEDGHSTFFHVLRRHKSFKEHAVVMSDELAAYDESRR